MKKLAFLFFILFSGNLFSQNLIPNPDFEQYYSCPSNPDQLSYCKYWFPFKETPDYFNTCSINSIFSPPFSYDFQYPHTGNAFAGFFTFVNNNPNNRELIASSLLTTLIIGQKYYISFYVNLVFNYNYGSTIASNKTGVRFSTTSYSYLNPAPINNIAHFYSNEIITDTAKWTKISGSFIADSAYTYIIIGNFFTDSLTDTISIASPYHGCAYYFIDDVCVSTDSLYCENWLGVKEQNANKEEITIYPNPANNYITITSENNEAIKQIAISDLTGRQVYSNEYKTITTETKIDVSFLLPGNYFVTITTLNNKFIEKLVVVR